MTLRLSVASRPGAAMSFALPLALSFASWTGDWMRALRGAPR